MFRTDNNNNPTAFTTDIAQEAGLVLGTDYEIGDSFQVPYGNGVRTYHTAKLLGNPLEVTIKVIDKIGFYTEMPHARWVYIAIPYKLWLSFTEKQKEYTIGIMYQNEGGTEMKSLFPTEPV
jgi:hypothetical protein